MRRDPILTPKQKQVLDFIFEFRMKNGYAPSQNEIAENFGFKSLGTVQNYLIRLERQGVLRKTWNARRGMQVVPPQPHHSVLAAVPSPLSRESGTRLSRAGQAPLSHDPAPLSHELPLVGRVAAGRPIEAIQTHETIEVPASMVKSGAEHFVLKVTGDSMIEDGILSGDYVVIKKQLTAHNGETVVALVGNEATIKKFYRKSGKVELHPANPAYQPLVIDSLVDHREFKIEGVLVGLIRRLD